MGLLLHLRQAPDGQAAGDLGDGALGPGIGGSAVATSTGPVDDSGLNLDTNAPSVALPTVTVPQPIPHVQQTSATPTGSLAPSVSPSTTQPAQAHSSNTTTVVIASVAAGAFVLIAAATLLLFCRSTKARRRQSRRGDWREIESHQAYGGQGSFVAGAPTIPRAPSEGMFESKSLYSTRRSTDAPPSINMHFGQEPLMAANPFARSPSPASPVPPMPALQHARQPQQIMVQQPIDPPSAGFSAPSEYTASYIRSVYSATAADQHSIADSHHTASSTPRSRSNTLKRAPDRAKNQHELIALDNLIAALDIGDDRQQQQNHLPDPSLFRAALGGPGHPGH